MNELEEAVKIVEDLLACKAGAMDRAREFVAKMKRLEQESA
jgi:hypothetical protein